MAFFMEGDVKMKYISEEQKQQIKRVDLLTYLKNYQPERLKKISHDTHCIKDHPSLHISNGLWHWQSCGIGGRSALDFLIKVDGYNFLDAAELILESIQNKEPTYIPYSKKETERILQLSLSASDHQRAIDYLVNRGIDEEIIKECIDQHLIYEGVTKSPTTKRLFHNVVFVGYGNGKAQYASIRGIQSDYKGEAPGSNKSYSFLLPATTNANEVHVCEAAIDALSYATLMKESGRDYESVHILSLGGVQIPRKDNIETSKTPIALEVFLVSHPEVTTIVLHLDNDHAGRMATRTIMKNLDNYICIDEPPRYGKDVNDQLCMAKAVPSNYKKQVNLSRER